MKNNKVRIKSGSVDEFFKSVRENAKKLDRGETIEPGITITFEDPLEMLEFLSAERVRLLRRAKSGALPISQSGFATQARRACGEPRRGAPGKGRTFAHQLPGQSGAWTLQGCGACRSGIRPDREHLIWLVAFVKPAAAGPNSLLRVVLLHGALELLSSGTFGASSPSLMLRSQMGPLKSPPGCFMRTSRKSSGGPTVATRPCTPRGLRSGDSGPAGCLERRP